jgi:RimJ/RimL family protein N-acetyltransferase
VTGRVRAMGDGASGEDLVTLETPRLILRQWQPADLDRYAELFADPEVARYIFRGQPARRERLTEMSGDYLRQWRDLRLGPFAVIDRATGAWIGQIGLNHLAYWPGAEKTEVGWERDRRWWGRGLATEGGRAALRFGFEERGLRRIISTAAPGNHASRHVMEKLGLTYRGTHVISGAEVVWDAINNTG